ncbi:MAG: carboxypeptidase regulatory-like domain-containing protein, partial [Planctomycetota bacterium]|nr:carboxypeptidase regulatory-like domain-containing protein [Planctomycetota bacterium]
ARRGVEISGYGPGVGTNRSVQTDAKGFFEADGLDSGRYRVSTGPTNAEVREVLGRPDDNAYELLASEETIEVADGETTHVVLAPPDLQPVRVYGRVLAGDEPVGDVRMRLHARNDEGRSPSVSTETDEDGNYEVTVAHPGEYQFQLWHSSGGLNVSVKEIVPAAESYHFDITFPVGSIAGRVLGPDGEPLVGIQVSASARAEDGSRLGGNVTTDRNGDYELPLLPTGSYTVRSGRSFGPFFEDAGYTEAKIEGVEVGPNARVTGIDLRLGEGAALEGIVRDAAGNPMEGAWVSLRNAEGKPVGGGGWPVSNEKGRYRISGVKPGEVSVSAVIGPLVSDENGVVLRGGETVRLDLVVEPGTVLVVRAYDAEGVEIERPSVEVEDGDGRDFTWFRRGVMFGPAQGDGGRRVGPLPRGTYRVLVRPKGNSKDEREQTVSVSGELERELRFDFD